MTQKDYLNTIEDALATIPDGVTWAERVALLGEVIETLERDAVSFAADALKYGRLDYQKPSRYLGKHAARMGRLAQMLRMVAGGCSARFAVLAILGNEWDGVTARPRRAAQVEAL